METRTDLVGVADIKGLSADSREIEPGFVFVAIPGTRADGAEFIPAALENGAAAIVVAPDVGELPDVNVPVLTAQNPRAALAHMAARIFPAQPEVICAITGTNGKTSIAAFLRQIWQHEGRKAASIGTLGVVTDGGVTPLAHTTPDPLTLHRTLDGLARQGVTHLALEASSHGLAQHRVDGGRVAAGGFTNVSRDHLDYHASFEAYVAAKMRLFKEIVKNGGAAVLNADADCYDVARSVAEARHLKIISTGKAGTGLCLLFVEPTSDGLDLSFVYEDEAHEVTLPLVGAFQSSNALVAAGLALATGSKIEPVVEALATLKGADGRMEQVAAPPGGGTVYVDYAHTPDALATALQALRPHTEGKLHLVFGAGGNRDKGKRPDMGRVAAQYADTSIVTDDNPRDEDPAAIRAEVLAEVPDAMELGDRRAAIELGLAKLGPGDALLVAGKGHETGQTVKGVTHPFKDADVIRALLQEGTTS